MYVGQVQDITARKRAEGDLRLFRAIIDQTTDGVEVIDPVTGRFLDANDRACAAHGYSRAEYLALGVTDVDLGAAGRPWSEVVGDWRTDARRTFDGRHRRKDGSAFPVEVSLSFIRLDREYLVAVVRDVTERRRLEEQFQQSQKMEAIGRLAGGIAHDFNNLLTVINGYGEVLAAGLPAGHPTRKSVGAIVAAGLRAAGLTRQLLTFSRKAIVEPKVLDLTALVADLHNMLGRVIGEDVRLVLATQPALGAVKADPGQLEQVLMNLVVNARDAMPTGGQLTIELRSFELDDNYARVHPTVRTGPYVLLAVADTGTGMDEATRARVFEPFFTTKGEKGTGLGLATVFGIVQQAGGHIDVYSEPGHGTTFKVYLPRIAAAADQSVVGVAPSEMPAGTETVLLVEDEDGVRALTRHVLAECGYLVLEARDGVDAMRMAARHEGPIDLLITDVVMPRLGGRATAVRLRADRPSLRVLYVSGYTDDAVVRHGILEAEVHFLQKPFTPLALAVKVRQVLDLPSPCADRRGAGSQSSERRVRSPAAGQ
jgi:PAS domain S-box-containing protein